MFKAQNKKTGEYVAMKWMKERYKDMEQINSLREVRALKRLSSHRNIITLIEVL